MRKIVSLLPAATEMVCALSAEEMLVGRSHECDYPESITALPKVTATRIAAEAASLAIHQQVQALYQAGKDLYAIDVEKLWELQPDLILTQGQCDVCAVSEASMAAILEAWPGPRPEVLSFSPRKLSDLWLDLRQLGLSLNREKLALEVGSGWAERLKQLHARAIKRSPQKVLCVEWIDPLMVAGNWVPELIQIAGGIPILATVGEHSGWADWDQVRQADPDVILFMPCGFSLGKTLYEMREAITQTPWSELRAVQAGAVYAMDGNQYFNRPGPRLIKSAEIVADILDKGGGDAGWKKAGLN